MSAQLRTRGGRVVRDPRTRFFRCELCSSELVHTVDLSHYRARRKPVQATEGSAPWWMLWRPLLPTVAPFVCHCGGRMREATIPRVVIPEPGGDGHIYEVMELDPAEAEG